MDKVKKVSKVAKKVWYKIDKKKLLKFLAQVIPWITKGKVTTSKVLSIGAFVIALGGQVFPDSSLNISDGSLNNEIEVLQKEQEKQAEAWNLWFGIQEKEAIVDSLEAK